MDNRWISKGRSPEEMMKDDAIRRRARMQEAAALANKVSQEDRNKLIKTIKIEKSSDPNADLGKLIEETIIDNWMDDFRYKNGLRGNRVDLEKDRMFFGSRNHRENVGVVLSYFMQDNVEGEANFFFTDEKGNILTDEQFLKCLQESHKKYRYESQQNVEIEPKEWNFLLTEQEDSIAKEGKSVEQKNGARNTLLSRVAKLIFKSSGEESQIAKEGKSVEQKKGELWYKLLNLPPEIGAKLILKEKGDWGTEHNLEWPSGVKVTDSKNPDAPQVRVKATEKEEKIRLTFSTRSGPECFRMLCRSEMRTIISDSYAKWQEAVGQAPQLDQVNSAESVMDKANSPLK